MERPSRSSSREAVSKSVHKRLELYALAAGAAGVSVLALAASAEGEIVYTPANQKITFNHPFELDLNNDGIADFQILNRHGFSLGRDDALEGMLGIKPTLPSNRAVRDRKSVV